MSTFTLSSGTKITIQTKVIQELVVGSRHFLIFEPHAQPSSNNMSCFDKSGALLWVAHDRQIGAYPNPYMNIYPFDEFNIRASCYRDVADILVSIQTGAFAGLFPNSK